MMTRAEIIRAAKRNKMLGRYNPLSEEHLQSADENKSNLAALNTSEEVAENRRLLEVCAQYWHNLSDMRRKRARVRNYLNGEQWGDRVDGGGNVTEKDVIKSDGNYPAQYNIMLPILKNMLGQFRGAQKRSAVLIREKNKQVEEIILTNAIQAVHDLNYTAELDAELIRERWTSGVSAQRITYEYWNERDQSDILIENCNPTRLFFNTDVRDVRLLDMRTVGMLYDYTLKDLVTDKNICRTQGDVDYLTRCYAVDARDTTRANLMSTRQQDSIDFYVPLDMGKCRVIEVWYTVPERRMYIVDTADGTEYINDNTRAELEQENKRRRAVVDEQNAVIEEYNALNPDDTVPLFDFKPLEYEEKFENITYFKRITPLGQTLQKGETPFAHQGTPFVVELRPLTDGLIEGDGYGLIDIQKQYNRLRLLMDIAIRYSIKGVILIPDTAIPDGWTEEEYCNTLTRIDGRVVYKVDVKNGNPKPELLSNAPQINPMLSSIAVDMKQIMSDVSGTSQASLGRETRAGMTATQYTQETNNAAINAVDFFRTYEAFMRRRDMKVLKIMQQYYPAVRNVTVLGAKDNTDIYEYEKEKLAHLDTDIMVVGTTNSPMQKMEEDAVMIELLKFGLPLPIYLKNSTSSMAPGLWEDYQKWEEGKQQGAGSNPQPPEGG
jgi:hypothetical protein